MINKCTKPNCDQYVIGHTTLRGNFATSLCAEHRNEWHKYFRLLPEYEELEELEVQYQVAVAGKDDRRAARIRRSIRACEDALYNIGCSWVNASDEEE